MGDDNKSFWDSMRPKWRDALAAGVGVVLGVKVPEYVKGKLEEQQRYQAKIFVEEMHKQEDLYKQKKAGEG